MSGLKRADVPENFLFRRLLSIQFHTLKATPGEIEIFALSAAGQKGRYLSRRVSVYGSYGPVRVQDS